MDYDAMTVALGRAIRANRIRHGFSQEEFALAAGLHRTYMSDVERGGRNISLRNLLLVSAAMRKPLSELIREAEEIVELRNEA